MVGLASATGQNLIGLGIDNGFGNGRLYMDAFNAGVGAAVHSGGTLLAANTWTHVAGVIASATSRRVYVNGVAGALQTSPSVAIPAALNRVMLGAELYNGAIGFPFAGQVAEVGVWSVALDGFELALLAAGANPSSVRPEALVFYAPCKDLATPTTDIVGARNLPWQAGASYSSEHPSVATATVTELTTEDRLQNGSFYEKGVASQTQRGGFSAHDRDWVFYTSEEAVYFSNTDDDGATWRAPELVRSMTTWSGFSGASFFDVHFDGTYLHYVAAGAVGGGASNTIKYRRGLPNSDGSITWSAVEQTAFTGDGSLLENSISVDSDGCPWITFEHFNQDSTPYPYPVVIKSSTSDGTWVTQSDFPYQLSAYRSHWWTGIGRLGNDGEMIAFYWNDQYFDIPEFGESRNVYFARVWDGDSWGSEITVDAGAPRLDLFMSTTFDTRACFATDPDRGVWHFGYFDEWANDGTVGTIVTGDDTGVTGFEQPTNFYNADTPGTMALGVESSTGDLMLAWTRNQDADLLWSRRVGGSWDTPTLLLSVGSYERHPGGLQITHYGERVSVLTQHVQGSGLPDLIEWYLVEAGGGGPEIKNVTGTISLTLPVVAADSKTVSRAASLALTSALSAGDTKTTSTAGTLPSAINAEGSVSKVISRTASIGLTTEISATDSKMGGAVGSLQLAVTASGGESKTGSVSGVLPLDLDIESTALKIANTLAEISVALNLSGDASTNEIVKNTVAGISVSTIIESVAAKTGQTSGQVALQMALAAADQKDGQAAAALALALAVDGDATKLAGVAGALGLTLTTSGDATTLGADSTLGNLSLALAIVAVASKQVSASAVAEIALGLSAIPAKTIGTTGSISLTTSLSGVASQTVEVETVVGTIALTFDLVGNASKMTSTTATIELITSLMTALDPHYIAVFAGVSQNRGRIGLIASGGGRVEQNASGRIQ